MSDSGKGPKGQQRANRASWLSRFVELLQFCPNRGRIFPVISSVWKINAAGESLFWAKMSKVIHSRVIRRLFQGRECIVKVVGIDFTRQ